MPKSKVNKTTTHKHSFSASLFKKVQDLMVKDKVDGWIYIKTNSDNIRIFEKDKKYRIGVSPEGALVPMINIVQKREDKNDNSTTHN